MGSGALIDIGLPLSLFLIMVGMGMTLTPKDFREVVVAPRGTFYGLVCQILLLPLIALGVALALDLSPARWPHHALPSSLMTWATAGNTARPLWTCPRRSPAR